MATFIPTASLVSSTTDGFVLSGVADLLYVDDGILIGSTAEFGTGVVAQTSFQTVEAAGNIAGYVGVSFAGVDSEIRVQAGGGVTGVGFGVNFDSDGGRIVNAGTISGENAIYGDGSLTMNNTGQVFGSQYGVAAGGSLSLVNNGSIIGPSAAISVGGASSIVNLGVIDGRTFLSDFGDSVVNRGVMTQDVLMLGGDDLVDGAGGQFLGQVHLGAGNDDFLGSSFGDTVLGGLGRDTMAGAGGNDVFLALDGDGSDEVDGGAGIDTYSFGSTVTAVNVNLTTGLARIAGATDDLTGIERIVAGHANDVLVGGGGGDILLGSLGNDRIYGRAGDDRLFGGLGTDLMVGDDGNDRLTGAEGRDTIQGGIGDDVLTGGVDVDLLTGGAGADRFVFSDFEDFIAISGGGLDRITDFVQGSDLIDLSAIDAVLSSLPDQAFSFVGTGEISDFGQINYRFSGAFTLVAIGYNSASAFTVLRLDGNLALTADDFIL